MKKSLLVAAVLLSIGTGCLVPREAGATDYYWNPFNQTWTTANLPNFSNNKTVLPLEGFTFSDLDSFYAGYDNEYGNITNNSITVGNVEPRIYNIVGGYSKNGIVVENEVEITGGTNSNFVYGGWCNSDDASTFVRLNRVTISGTNTKVNTVYGGYALFGPADKNIVNINGGSISNYVAGGYVLSGSADNNIVNINGGSISNYVAGGYTDEGFAAINIVNINAGTVQDVYGGMANGDRNGSAVNNIVTWKAGEIKGNVYGSAIQYLDKLSFSSAYKPVKNNGGTFNVYHSSGTSSKTISAGKEIAGFDKMNFYLSGDVKAGSVIIDNSKANAVKMDGVSVSLENDPDKTLDSDFFKGDKIYLIKNTEGSITPATTELTANGLKYDFEVSTQDNALIATSLSGEAKGPNEETKALLEGHAAAALAVNQMVDNTINVALKDAELAASETADKNSTNNNFNAFVSANYNKDRISTGSYVDVKGLSGTIGIARKLNNKSGALTYGLFLEGGKNKFDTSNDFASGSVHGKGDANSFGGGFFAKQKNSNGMYVEGSLRVGRVNHDFEGFVAKQNAEYDAKSTYYGAHIGLGKLIASGKGEWDVYGKLIYTHINGATADVYDGSELELDAMNSTRLRVGGRYNVNPAPKAVGYYAGLAYEYEFGGQADGKLHGFGLEAPTSKGSTGILELGAKFQPTQNFGIDLGVEGHAGKRRGVGGNVNFKWSF